MYYIYVQNFNKYIFLFQILLETYSEGNKPRMLVSDCKNIRF